MALRAVRIGAGPTAAGSLQRCELGPDPGRFLVAAKSRSSPAVYVVTDEDLTPLRALRDVVVDRGRKNKAKALSRLLLGRDKIPLVSGGHTASGQLIRSARTLLNHAVKQGERNVFVVGTNPKLLEELWQRARETAPGTDPTPATMTRSPQDPPKRAAAANPPPLLLDLLPQLPVPEKLRQQFVGVAAEIQLVRQLILRAAASDAPVLILGDTGTGKEIVARLIHDQSRRRFMTFTSINCGAIPRELLESELFGHEPGSHSQAFQRKLGLWSVAQGGTLFLDEIGDLAPEHQVKILRALEEGEIRPIGGIKDMKVDARVIAATNRDLFSMVQADEFREDLYYRLRSLMIFTPPLRDHPEDIPLLADYFWSEVTRDAQNGLAREIHEELQDYRWPGNARELKAVLSSLFTLFGPKGLTVAHLRAVFQFEGQASARGRKPKAREEIGLHRVECLRHLRRVDEVVRALSVALRPVVEERRTDAGTVRAVQVAARHRQEELEALCLRPLLFHREATFSCVHRLKARLGDFSKLLETDAERAVSSWTLELADEFRQVLSTIFEEVELLLKQA